MEPTAQYGTTTEYEAPTLVTLGSVAELTEWCPPGLANGKPDHFQHGHFANCSS